MTISPPTRAGNFRPIRRDGICRARRTDGAKHFLGQTWTVLTALAVTVPLEFTKPVRPPARTASFDDVEVPSASATRNSSRRAKTAGAALVLRARKNGGHRQRRFSCPLGVRCLSHDCTIMRGLLVPVSLRRKP